MRIIEQYAKKVAILEYVNQDAKTQKEFLHGVLGSMGCDHEPLPGEKPEAEELARNRAKLGADTDIAGFESAMRKLDGLNVAIGKILVKSRELAETNPGYPDFAKIHLALRAVWREINYQRHILGD